MVKLGHLNVDVEEVDYIHGVTAHFDNLTADVTTLAGVGLEAPVSYKNATVPAKSVTIDVSSAGVAAITSTAGDITLQDVTATTLKAGTGAAISAFTTSGALIGNSDANVPTEKAVKSYAMPASYLYIDGTFAANSDGAVPTEKATKTYIASYTAANSIPMSYLSTDGTYTANSDAKVPSEKATKTYVNTTIAAATLIPNTATSFKNSIISWFDPTTATPPNPSDGDRYIAQATKSATPWVVNYIMSFLGAVWIATSPVEGDHVYDRAMLRTLVFRGSSWITEELYDERGLGTVSPVKSVSASIPVSPTKFLSYIHHTILENRGCRGIKNVQNKLKCYIL